MSVYQMSLEELIDRLSEEDPDKIIVNGFGSPHSYRGFYDQLAFSPENYVTVGSMLKHAKSAVGKTFEGYKGGHYTMTLLTPVFIADYGEYNGEEVDEITYDRLENLLRASVPKGYEKTVSYKRHEYQFSDIWYLINQLAADGCSTSFNIQLQADKTVWLVSIRKNSRIFEGIDTENSITPWLALVQAVISLKKSK